MDRQPPRQALNSAPQFPRFLTHDSGDGEYHYVRFLSNGAFGQLWLVQHARTQKQYAAKIVTLEGDPRATRARELEAIALKSCSSVFVVRCFDDRVVGDHLIIIMEYCPLSDLHLQAKQRKLRGERIPAEFVELIAAQLILALHHIHVQCGILHRDLKASNVYPANDSGWVKVGDFGLSKIVGSVGNANVANTFCGTPEYMPPELWEGKPYGRKADMWSLGVLIYELVNMECPFRSETLEDIRQRVLNLEIPPLQCESTDFADMVRQLLSRDAAERPDTTQLLRLPVVMRMLHNLEQYAARAGLPEMAGEIARANQLPPREVLESPCLWVQTVLDEDGPVPIREVPGCLRLDDHCGLVFTPDPNVDLRSGGRTPTELPWRELFSASWSRYQERQMLCVTLLSDGEVFEEVWLDLHPASHSPAAPPAPAAQLGPNVAAARVHAEEVRKLNQWVNRINQGIAALGGLGAVPDSAPM